MDKRNDFTKENIEDVENLPNSRNVSGVSQRFSGAQNQQGAEANMDSEDDLDMKEGTEADVDDDDLAILNSTDAEIGRPQNVSNEDITEDLDVPGSELDDMITRRWVKKTKRIIITASVATATKARKKTLFRA